MDSSAQVNPLKAPTDHHLQQQQQGASAGESAERETDVNRNVVDVIVSGDPERIRDDGGGGGGGRAETKAVDAGDRKEAGNEDEAWKIPMDEVEEEEEDGGTGEDAAAKPFTTYGYSDTRKMMEDDGKVVETRSSQLKRIIVKQIWQPKKREWRLILFVIFLFVLIVAGLVVIYHLHREELYHIYHHHNVTLHKTQLDVRFRNATGSVVLTGTLWKNSPPRGKPYDCSAEGEGENEGHGEGQGRLCLLWKTVRRLEIDHFRAEGGGSVCHRIRWHFLSPDASDDNTDCFDLDGADGGVRWFGAGILKNASGTLDTAFIARQAFVTGDLHAPGAFGPVVERLFLGSEGVAIVVEANSTLELSVNAPDRQLCLHAPAHPPVQHQPVFGYVVCIDESVTKVRRTALSLLAPDSSFRLPPMENFFDRPVWSTWGYLKDHYNETSLLDFADEIAERFKGGLMMMDEGWEVEIGDLEFTTSKFKDPRATIKALRQKGFQASLEVRAQVSTRSSAFENATIQRHLVTSLGDDDDDVPALVRRWSGPQETPWDRGLTGVYDLVDDDAGALLAERLTRLRDAIGVDAFHLAGTEASSLPSHSAIASVDRNEQTRCGVEVASGLGHSPSIVESASGVQNLSAVVRLVGGTSSWDGPGGLRSLVPSALTLGLLGYPVFLSESVGGAAFDALPAKELYLRWFQVSAFLPVVHLSVPPWIYDNETQTAVERLLGVRRSLVLPEIQSILKTQPSNLIHSPIVRPIWWLDPADRNALGVVTEFLVGDNILFAPVLDEGQVRRDVYLPRGLWRDPSLGVNHSGPRWLRDYAVNLTSVAYFIRQ